MEQQNQESPQSNHVSKSLFLMGMEFTFEFFKTTLFVICIALIFRYFLLQPFIVVGQSMEPSFYNKEYLIVDKLSYRLKEPKRGEVIIFHPPQYPKESYIKRIIGLPGEKVEIKRGEVYINGQLLDENYIKITDEENSGVGDMTVILENDNYFVLGDNRDHSSDSREIGPIPKTNFQGRAMIVLFPINAARIIRAPKYKIMASFIGKRFIAILYKEVGSII